MAITAVGQKDVRTIRTCVSIRRTLTRDTGFTAELLPMGSSKSERVGLRATPEQKELLERAADLQGESMSGFVLSKALEAARSAIREHQVTELSRRDWDRFTRLIERDEAPSAALKGAASRYEAEIGGSDA